METINENSRVSKVSPAPNFGKGPEDALLMTFFTGELKGLYWAEQKLTQTLPKMAEAATSEALKQLFTKHLTETQQHVTRLERAFGLLNVPPEAVMCKAMAGIIAEGEGIINDTPTGTATRDAGLILAARKVEHYEIASYGSLAVVAQTLGLLAVSGLLNATLDEENGADKMLTLAASSGINRTAALEQKSGRAA